MRKYELIPNDGRKSFYGKPPPVSWLNCGTVGAQRQEDILTLFAV